MLCLFVISVLLKRLHKKGPMLSAIELPHEKHILFDASAAGAAALGVLVVKYRLGCQTRC